MKHTVSGVTLSTGTKGLLIDIPNSEVVDIKIYFRAGYQFGDFSKYEIPHLLEHHIFNGTKQHPKNHQLLAELRKNGAMHNASTNTNMVTYWSQCAEFELDRVFGLMVENTTTPLFDKSAYPTERDNVRTELTNNLSDHSRQTIYLIDEASFPEHVLRYETRLKQLDSILHEDVVNYYHKTHTARNGGFIISGAIEHNGKVILANLEKLFTQLPLGSQFHFSDVPGLGQAKPINNVVDIESNYFRIKWYGIGGGLEEQVEFSLLSAILTKGWASRVFGKARDKGLTYSINSGTSHSKTAFEFGFAGFVNPSRLKELLELISTEGTDIVKNGVSEKELTEARNLIIGSITMHTQTTGSVSSWYSGDYVFDETILSYDQYFDLLRQVTPLSVQQAANKIFLSPAHASAYVGPLTNNELVEYEKVLAPVWR